MRYNKIRKMDIANGPGVRVSVFTQGCEFHCKNCFNSETWDFNKGSEMTEEVMDHILDLCSSEYIKGLSILGGEPLHPENIHGTTILAKKFKEKYPEKDLWIWSGFLFDKYIVDQDIVKYADVIVDGQYKDEEHDFTLRWRGSKNQRVIDVKKSLKENNVVLLKEEVYA